MNKKMAAIGLSAGLLGGGAAGLIVAAPSLSCLLYTSDAADE